MFSPGEWSARLLQLVWTSSWGRTILCLHHSYVQGEVDSGLQWFWALKDYSHLSKTLGHLHNWEAWFSFLFKFQLHCPWFCSKLIFVQAKPEQSEKINDLFLSFLWSLQPIGVEIEGNLKLLELQLENVEGGKMEVIPLLSNFVFSLFETQVHGFGPLNWLAGRKVSDLVQETLLQVIFKIFWFDWYWVSNVSRASNSQRFEKVEQELWHIDLLYLMALVSRTSNWQ